MFAIPNINIDLGIWFVLVPNPARKRVATGLLDFAHVVWQRRGANAPRKNKESKANQVKSYENSQGVRKRAVAPIAALRIRAGKNVERREQGRLVETIDNVVWLDPMPQAH